MKYHNQITSYFLSKVTLFQVTQNEILLFQFFLYLLIIGGSRGHAWRMSSKGPDSFISAYKFFQM